MSGVEDKPSVAAETTEVLADPTPSAPDAALNSHYDSTTGWIPNGWTRSTSGFLVPVQLAETMRLAEKLEKESPLSLLLAEKIRQTPPWAAALDKWAAAATKAANVVVKVVATAAPAIEQASRAAAYVMTHPRTPEYLEAFLGLLILAEEVEAEGGGTDAFVLVTARMRLEQAGVAPDSLLRSKLQQLVSQHGDEFTIRYLMDLLDHHRDKLVGRLEGQRVQQEAAVMYDALRKNPNHRLMQALVGLQESQYARLRRELPGAIVDAEADQLSKRSLMAGVEKRVFEDNRRLGMTRKRKPDEFDVKREQIISSDARPPEYEDPYEDPHALASFIEKENELWIGEIARQGVLQPRQLEILTLRVLEHLEPEEIAAKLGIARSTVDVQLHKIRRSGIL